MRNGLKAWLAPLLFVGAAFLLVMLSAASAHCQDIPRAALPHRAALTRIAHAEWGLDAPVPAFAAQIHQESGWNSEAVSAVGARGMAQFMPATATWWCALNQLSVADCQPRNPVWAMRALVGYDRWLLQHVHGASEFDRVWAALRAYNGGLGHWLHEAEAAAPAADRPSIDRACGRASRSPVHCAENLAYPERILNRIQPRYAAWGRSLRPT